MYTLTPMTYYHIIYKTVTVRSTNPMVQFFMGFITTDSWGLTQTVATDCSPAAVPNQ